MTYLAFGPLAVIGVLVVLRTMEYVWLTLVHTWVRHRRVGRERAEALLRELLTEEEYQQLERQDYLTVHSALRPRWTYRVPRNLGEVQVYEGDVPVMALCVRSTQPIPDGDAVLMHKLMIEGNEGEDLRLANRLVRTCTVGSGERDTALTTCQSERQTQTS